MASRLIVRCLRIVALMMFIVTVRAPVAVGQEPQPITDKTKRVEIPGVSVLPPQGDSWFLYPVSERDDSETGLIRLVKRLRATPPTKPDQARIVLAGVLVHDTGETKTPTAAELTREIIGETKTGEMITQRQRLIAFEGMLEDSTTATCLRFTRVTEIAGQFPTLPSLIAIASTHGRYCAHPQWPQYHVQVTYQQIYAKGSAALSLDAERDAFLESVTFSTVKPLGTPQLREILRADFEAGVLAYNERRWADAEVSLLRAVRKAETLGPSTPTLAVTLYYLGSAEDRQDRSRDAQAVFERALGIFDAQPTHDNAEVLKYQGVTLNDLAVLHARKIYDTGDLSASRDEFETARSLFQRALALQEARGPNDSGLIQTLGNLAKVHMDFAAVLRKSDRENEAQEFEALARQFLDRIPKQR